MTKNITYISPIHNIHILFYSFLLVLPLLSQTQNLNLNDTTNTKKTWNIQPQKKQEAKPKCIKHLKVRSQVRKFTYIIYNSYMYT